MSKRYMHFSGGVLGGRRIEIPEGEDAPRNYKYPNGQKLHTFGGTVYENDEYTLVEDAYGTDFYYELY